MDKAAYYLALDGVTRYGLAEAVKSIMKNGLGHAFFPSPPELRGQCDKAMEYPERERERIRRRELEAEAMKSQAGDWREPTASEKARVSATYAEFCKGYEKAAAEETFMLDPELVAQIPDNPKVLVRQRQGRGN